MALSNDQSGARKRVDNSLLVLVSTLGIPAPSLNKVIGTHQCSKKHKIRGYYGRNAHVLEILKKGVFLHRRIRDLGKKG